MNMMNYLKRNIRFLVAIASLLCISWTGSWDQIKKTAESIKSIQADFIQKKNLKMLSKPMISRGRFLYASPQSIRWEYFSPVHSIMLFHNGSVTRYIKHNNTFREDSGGRLEAMQVVMNEIMNWIKGCFNCNTDFDTMLAKGRVILTPKKKAIRNIISKIELVLSKRPGIIQSITIHESGSNSTVLLFQNVVLNRNIPQTLFLDH